MLLWIVASAVLLGVVAWIRERNLSAPKTKFDLALPPYVPLGELKANNPEESVLEKAATKYGDVFAVRVPFWTSFVFFAGPSASKLYHMVKEEDASLTHGYSIVSRAGGMPEEYINGNPESIVVFTKAFTLERYRHFARVMRDVILDHFDTEWNKPYQEVDFFPHVYTMTLNVIVRSFMGSDMTKEELAQFVAFIKEFDMEERVKSLTHVIKNQLPSSKKHTAERWIKFQETLRRITEQRMAKSAASEDSVEFIDYLINSVKDETGQIDYGNLATRVLGLVFAAASNNFATAAWLSFFTLSKPELMAPLMQEQKEYIELCKDPNADLSHALINKFNFTDLAIKETIRLCSGGLAMRRAQQDFVIDNKYVIPKGWFLILPHFTVVHNKQVYNNPFEFNPNRLLTEAKNVGELPVFGAGRHPCIGMKFALMNVKTLVFNLLDQYDIELPGPAEDFMPKYQNVGVFRPTTPVILKMRRKIRH